MPTNVPLPAPRLLWVLGLSAAALWAYWPTFREMSSVWSSDPQYSHGYLVPVFAGVLLWLRKSRFAGDARADYRWWSVPVLLAAVAMRLAGAVFYLTWVEQISLLPALAAIALAVGGWPAFRWAWPPIAFLAFMVPLPGRLSGALAQPLQRVATLVSTNILQTLGFPAQSEGTVILLSEVEMGIVEACSGLRMLVVFAAVATAVAIVIRRPLWQRVVVLLSAAPIALACNVVRITATGVLHETAGSEVANYVFHDLAGWLMMPLALFLLWLELLACSRLLLDRDPQRSAVSPFALPAAGPAPAPTRP